MHAVVDAVFARQAAEFAAGGHAAVFERVGLDDKVVVLGGALREGLDHGFEELGPLFDERRKGRRRIVVRCRRGVVLGLELGHADRAGRAQRDADLQQPRAMHRGPAPAGRKFVDLS